MWVESVKVHLNIFFNLACDINLIMDILLLSAQWCSEVVWKFIVLHSAEGCATPSNKKETMPCDHLELDGLHSVRNK